MASNGKRKNPSGDQIGYGKPPAHTQFKKGQSGNLKGRPKGTLNRRTVLARILREPVVINENGQRKKVTKQEAIYKQLVNKAVSCDLKAIKLSEDLQAAEEGAQAGTAPNAALTEVDQKVIEGILKRFNNSLSNGAKHGNDR
jgi:hypothetical protein